MNETASVMCPSCNEKNNPAFVKCWKCGFVLDENKLIAPAAQAQHVVSKRKFPKGVLVFIVFSLFGFGSFFFRTY